MNFNRLLVLILLIVFTSACSSSKESTSDTNSSDQEVYVFDDVSDVNNDVSEETTIAETTSHEAVEVAVAQRVETPQTPPAPTQIVGDSYVVQVGAFSTREKAENFLKDAKNKIKYQLNITQSEKSNFFVVQSSPFNSREAVEKVRNELWNIPQFKDAFIVHK